MRHTCPMRLPPSLASLVADLSRPSRNSEVPERAIVPRFSCSAFLVMPIPVSTPSSAGANGALGRTPDDDPAILEVG